MKIQVPTEVKLERIWGMRVKIKELVGKTYLKVWQFKIQTWGIKKKFLSKYHYFQNWLGFEEDF